MLGYISWHQLFYSYISCLLSADLFMLLFSYLLFTVYHVIQLSSVYGLSCYYYVHTIYMHGHFLLFLHTHWVTFWRPWICMSRLDISFHWSGIHWDRTLHKDPVYLYLVLVFLSLLLSCYFLILDISDSVIFFNSWFTWYHVWISICVTAVIMIYCSLFL